MSEIPIKAMKYDDANKDPHQFYPLTVPEAIIFPDGTNGKQAFDAVINDMSDVFSDQKTYEVGDYCIYNNVLYKFIAQKTAGAWDSSKASVTTIDAELKSLLNQINTLNSGTIKIVTVYTYGDYSDCNDLPAFTLAVVYASAANRPTEADSWIVFTVQNDNYKTQYAVTTNIQKPIKKYRNCLLSSSSWSNWGDL